MTATENTGDEGRKERDETGTKRAAKDGRD